MNVISLFLILFCVISCKIAQVKYYSKNITNYLLVIAILFNVSCTQKREQEQGTMLTKFEITNSELNSATDSVVKDYVNDKLFNSIITLSFEEDGDTLFFTYTGFGSMKELSNEYLFYRHYRLIGYIERKPYNIILFSNIHPYNHMLERTKQMIKPSDKTSFFNGLSCEPFTKLNWIESYREPMIRRHYKYYDGKIKGMNIKMD